MKQTQEELTKQRTLVMHSRISFSEHPSLKELALQILPSLNLDIFTAEQVAEHLLNGESIQPKVVLNGNSSEARVYQRIFFVDCGCSLEDLLSNCKKNDIAPFFIYKTYSYIEAEPGNLCAVFLTDRLLTDINEIRKMQDFLTIAVIGNSLATCREKKVYFGTSKGAAYENFNAFVKVDQILRKQENNDY